MGKHRFAPQSAKDSGRMTKGELAEQIAETYRADFRTPRAMTKDLCDFCLKVCYMYKTQLGLRLRGKKFVCEVCRFKDGRQEEAKKIAALPCWHTREALIKFMKRPRK